MSGLPYPQHLVEVVILLSSGVEQEGLCEEPCVSPQPQHLHTLTMQTQAQHVQISLTITAITVCHCLNALNPYIYT